MTVRPYMHSAAVSFAPWPTTFAFRRPLGGPWFSSHAAVYCSAMCGHHYTSPPARARRHFTRSATVLGNALVTLQVGVGGQLCHSQLPIGFRWTFRSLRSLWPPAALTSDCAEVHKALAPSKKERSVLSVFSFIFQFPNSKF